MKYNKLKHGPLKCSHIIAIGMCRDEREAVPEIEEVCAVACAVQNMLLTATAYHIGAYWSTGGITFDKDALPFFGLGEKDQLLGFLYIGVPQSPEWREGTRKPIAEKVKWVE